MLLQCIHETSWKLSQNDFIFLWVQRVSLFPRYHLPMIPCQHSPPLSKQTGKHRYKNKNGSKIVVCLDPVHSRMHKAAGRRLSRTVHGKWKDSHQADWTATRELSNLKRKWKIQGVVMGRVAQSHQAWEPLPWHHHPKNLYQCVLLFGIWRDPDVVCK